VSLAAYATGPASFMEIGIGAAASETVVIATVRHISY
jgi:hypothetical protein